MFRDFLRFSLLALGLACCASCAAPKTQTPPAGVAGSPQVSPPRSASPEREAPSTRAPASSPVPAAAPEPVPAQVASPAPPAAQPAPEPPPVEPATPAPASSPADAPLPEAPVAATEARSPEPPPGPTPAASVPPPAPPAVEPAPGASPDSKAAAASLQKPPYLLTLEPTGPGAAVDVSISVASLSRAEPLSVQARLGDLELEVSRYAPSVLIQEAVVPALPGRDGFPALQLFVISQENQWQTWLVPGSKLLGNVALPTVLVECLPEQNALELLATESQLSQLAAKGPKLLFESKADGRRLILSASQGSTSRVDFTGHEIQVLRFLNCFGLDSRTGEVVEQSQQPLNPAVEVKISRNGQSRTAWLFSQYPEFSRDGEDEVSLLRFIYPLPEHPHERASLTVIAAAQRGVRAFVGAKGKLYKGELLPGDYVQLGGFSLRLVDQLARATIQQTATEGDQGVPAVLLRWKGAAPGERWVPLGVPEEIRAPGVSLVARLRSTAQGPHGAESPGGPNQGALPAGHPAIRPTQQLPSGHPQLPQPAKLPPGHPPTPPR